MITPTATAFRAWLQNREPGACVGRARKHYSCPVARWLCGQTGIAVQVTPTRIEIDGGRLVPAAWLRRFIVRVDQLGQDARVTASEALRLLDAEGSD